MRDFDYRAAQAREVDNGPLSDNRPYKPPVQFDYVIEDMGSDVQINTAWDGIDDYERKLGEDWILEALQEKVMRDGKKVDV